MQLLLTCDSALAGVQMLAVLFCSSVCFTNTPTLVTLIELSTKYINNKVRIIIRNSTVLDDYLP